MIIPPNTEVFDGVLAILWFENGILHANAKNTPRTLERQQEMYKLIETITGGKKVCLVSDVTLGSSQSKEVREYMSRQIPMHFIAMATISESAFGELVTNTFLNYKQPIPMRLFKSQQEALQWLKGFL